jgi:hypothetical protein
LSEISTVASKEGIYARFGGYVISTAPSGERVHTREEVRSVILTAVSREGAHTILKQGICTSFPLCAQGTYYCKRGNVI